MYGLHLLFYFLVIGGEWAASQDACDLNLQEVFRTPKDFSKVDFDHFEIVERNNFPAPVAIDDGIINTVDLPQSVANAQVMLRFGGDIIDDGNYLAAAPYIDTRFAERGYNLGDVRPLFTRALAPAPSLYSYNEFAYPGYSPFLPPAPLTPSCGYPGSFSYPPPPYDFPGFFYGMRPYAPFSPAPWSYYNAYNGLLPAEEIIEPSTTFIEVDSSDSSESSEEVKAFLDGSEKLDFLDVSLKSCDGIEISSEEKTLVTNIPDILTTQDVIIKDEVYQSPDFFEETIVETAAVDPPYFAYAAPDVQISTIDVSTVDPYPYPHTLSYANLYDVEKEAACVTPIKPNFEILMDQALVPFNGPTYVESPNWWSSYPAAGAVITTADEVIESPVSYYEPWAPAAFWARDPRIPFGQRFVKDIDSLLEVVPPATNCVSRYTPPFLYRSTPYDIPSKIYPTIEGGVVDEIISEPYVSKEVRETIVAPYEQSIDWWPSTRVINNIDDAAPLVYGGYSTKTSTSFVSSAVPDECDRPKLIFDGYKTTSGTGYFSDPIKSVIYKEPTITDVVTLDNPTGQIVEEKVIEPQMYQVIPKYDIETIDGWVPSDRYLYDKCNDWIPPTAIYQKEVLPVERSWPLWSNAPFISGWPFPRDSIRDAPLVANYVSHNYCPAYSKLTEEIAEATI